MKQRAKYSDNAGMTLVELMVAVTMLAIIVVPLLHTFATSANLGLKSRRNLRITTAAQDLMEGLKAESVESLSCSFNYPDDDIAGAAPATKINRTANSFKNFHVVASDLVGEAKSVNLLELRADVVESKTSPGYRNISNLKDISALTNGNMGNFGNADATLADLAASTKQTADEMGYDFYGKSNKKYFFAIKNMQIEGAGTDPNFEVDALIELDGSNYTSTGTAKKTSSDGSDKALLNEHGRISYGALDEKRDAFFIQDEALGRQTAQEFNVAYSSWVGVDCTEKDLSRKYVITTTDETKLDASKEAVGGAHWITVKCKVIYTSSDAFQVPPEHEKYDPTLSEQPYTREYEYTIFDNKLTGYAPENIFFCYYPGYGAPAADEIIYVNEHEVPSILHLIKQEGKNNGTLNQDEFAYKCKVRVNEGHGASEDTAGSITSRSSSMTQIRTNLDSNLYKVYMPSAPDCRNQAEYRYNGVIISRDFNKPELSGIYTLGGEVKTSDSMYDVTIDIYQKGTLDEALSSDGTISNKKILFTLKGSMN